MTDMESDHVERTVSTNSMDKFGEAVCAFSNDISDLKKPGYLLIGVNDKSGELSGLKATDEMLRNIASIRSEGNVLPQPSMTVHKYSFGGGDVIAVEVQPAHFPPVRYKGTIWLRIGPRRAVANEMEERMLVEKRTSNITTFDEHPMAQTTINDLNLVRFKLDYLPRAVEQNTLRDDDRDAKLQLASLRFYDLRSDCPTVAGIITFGKNVRYFFPMAYVQYVKFEGTKVSSRVLAENQFFGDMISVVEDLDRFVRNNIVEKRPVPVSALRERLLYNYPQWAIREFLMNALMHRSYELTAPIKFYQYADRIEIINPGGLYGNARPENFPNVSDYRNLILSEAMRVMGFVNRFNRGIATAQVELAENGNGQAEFDINTFGVFGVTIREKNVEIDGSSTEKSVSANLEKQILQIIYDKEGIRIDEICRLTQKSKRTVNRYLNRLKERNLIEFVGALKTGSYRVNASEIMALENSDNGTINCATNEEKNDSGTIKTETDRAIDDDGTLNGTINGTINGAINGTINEIDSIENDSNPIPNSKRKLGNKEKILMLIQENPKITIKKIAEILSISDRNARRILAELVSEKRLARKGSRKSGLWKIIEKSE